MTSEAENIDAEGTPDPNAFVEKIAGKIGGNIKVYELYLYELFKVKLKSE